MPTISVTVIHEDGKFATLAQIEAEAIEVALRACKCRGEAARLLGMGRSTLYRKIDDYGLDGVEYDPDYAPEPPPEPVHRPFVSLPTRLRRAVGCDSRWQPEILLTA